MSKLSTVAAALAVTPLFAVTTASAGALGQVGAGDIYRVRNISNEANGAFANTVNATCGQTVQFRVRIHNSGPDAITNVNVKATLENTNPTSKGSKVTVTADNLINGEAVTDVAGVNTDKATTISYVSGSTELLGYSEEAGQSPVLRSLPDGIVGDGVNIGTVGPLTSDTESVQFKAELNCENTPTQIKVCDLNTKKIVTINENDFDSAKYTKDLSKCSVTTTTTTTTPTELVKTGPTEVAAVFAAAAAFGVVVYNFVLRRQNAR